ncbi:hypothetical protein [Aeromonas sp. 600479]|uniref:hypothetical protein n=1 Tax=Aeromonas sp. 600479 TaxID=2712028 RepID=UPI003B9DE75B
MRFISAAVLGVVLLAGCDGNSATSSDTATTQAVTAPVLDEASILKESGLTTVRRYGLEDGHGFYMQESPDAAIEFRDNPPRINVALRTFPEAGYEAKNATANGIAKKLVSVITGTDGQLVDDVIAGEIKPGKQFINGLSVNVSGMEHDWLITVSK